MKMLTLGTCQRCQRWARSRIRSPTTFFGSRFKYLWKTGAGFGVCGMVYIARV